MHINQLKEAKFLKKEDVGNGALVTIRSLTQENVAKAGADAEMKWCIHFDELDKPLVINSINAQLIAQVCKSEDTDNWTGHKIVLYNDPTISYAGKVVGGIRVRAPRNQAPAPAPTPASTAEPDVAGDDVPF